MTLVDIRSGGLEGGNRQADQPSPVYFVYHGTAFRVSPEIECHTHTMAGRHHLHILAFVSIGGTHTDLVFLRRHSSLYRIERRSLFFSRGTICLVVVLLSARYRGYYRSNIVPRYQWLFGKGILPDVFRGHSGKLYYRGRQDPNHRIDRSAAFLLGNAVYKCR